MQFNTWLKKKYINEHSPKGDLARDIKSDGFYFPKQGRHGKVRKYLICHNACEACLDAFEECWKEYEECEKNRLKQN
ncbi:MAG: sterile alpha motif-like domain-containing protein [Intestinimonas sp.]|jgi:uncharacterized protein YozE (UPF0346 family)|nr:sterile alpha motif-like domain-containing protein [Intestinimonas sp.]